MATLFNRSNVGGFQKDSSIYSIFHGSNAFLLEDELNESQWTNIERLATQIREQYSSGFLKSVNINASGYSNFFSINSQDGKPLSLYVDGYLLKIGNNNPGSLPSGLTASDDKVIIKLNNAGTSARTDLVMLEAWFEVMSYSDTIRKYGGDTTPVLTNNIRDSRTQIETSRRIQFRWRLRVVDNESSVTNVYASQYDGTVSSVKYTAFESIYVADTGIKKINGTDLKAPGIVYGIPLFTVLRPSNDNTINSGNITNAIVKSNVVQIGSAANLKTNAKDSFVDAINEIAKSISTYTWTATEGQTVFTLPTGQTYNANTKSIEVYVLGIKQITDINYTETNNSSFTLSEGVPAGTLVEARWYQGAVPAVLGHGNTHKVGGTDELNLKDLAGYSLMATLAALNERGVSITRPPAPFVACSGTGDDTVAFQNLINNFSNIYIPDGTFTVNASVLTINRNVKWVGGQNSKLVIKGLSLTSSSVTDVKFENIIFCSTEVSSGDPTAPDTQVAKSILSLNSANLNILINGCTFMWQTPLQTNCFAIGANSLNSIKVKNCIILSGGIQILDANYYDISDNYFDTYNMNLAEQIHAQHNIKGIIKNNQMYNSAMDFIDQYAHGHETIIEGNRFSGGSNLYMEIKAIFRDSGVWGGSSTEYGNVKKVIIKNNFFLDNKRLGDIHHNYFINGYCLDLRTTPVANDYQYYNSEMIFEGNFFEDKFQDPTIVNTTYRYGMVLSGWSNVKFLNNTFKMLSGSSTPLMINQQYFSSTPTLAPQRPRYLLIQGNTFNATAAAVYISEADKIILDNNFIFQDTDQTVQLPTGIYVEKATSVQLSNCMIDDAQYSLIATNVVGDISVINCPRLGKLRFGNATYIKCNGNDIKGDVVLSGTIGIVDMIGNSHDSNGLNSNVSISGSVDKLKLVGNTMTSPGWNLYVTGSYNKIIQSANILNYGKTTAMYQSTTIDKTKLITGDDLFVGL